MQYSTIHVHCMCFACVKTDCHAANLINRTEPIKKRTRRRAVLSASDDRTARRQFQAIGQPVSRTQASDAMTSRLLRCCAMRRSVCNAGASNAHVLPFVFRYQGNGATPCQYIDTTRKAIDCATTLPLRVFI